MFLKNAYQCLEMFKACLYGLSLIVILSTPGCDFSDPEQRRERPMVYEGMSVNDLTITLGSPDSVQSGGTVYNADLGRTQKVEKWYFDSRTVVVIDDTVKTTNIIER